MSCEWAQPTGDSPDQSINCVAHAVLYTRVHRCIIHSVGQGQGWEIENRTCSRSGLPIQKLRVGVGMCFGAWRSRSTHCQQECNYHASSYPNHNHSTFGSHTTPPTPYPPLFPPSWNDPAASPSQLPDSFTAELKHPTQIRSIYMELG